MARLDNAEYRQALTQAEADLAVARANLGEAESLLKIADRELSRIETLSSRGVSSESERDTARASQLARAAHLEVTRAQVTRAAAAVETARIRLGYSTVTASWSGGNNQRIVAERFFDEGQTVAANEPLLRIVELDPVMAVFYVTERDYGLLGAGQIVSLANRRVSRGNGFAGCDRPYRAGIPRKHPPGEGGTPGGKPAGSPEAGNVRTCQRASVTGGGRHHRTGTGPGGA